MVKRRSDGVIIAPSEPKKYADLSATRGESEFIMKIRIDFEAFEAKYERDIKVYGLEAANDQFSCDIRNLENIIEDMKDPRFRLKTYLEVNKRGERDRERVNELLRNFSRNLNRISKFPGFIEITK